MSKLEELIEKLCPNGVEWKRLGEIFITKNGYTPSKANKSYWENGNIPWFRMDDIRTNGRILYDSLEHVNENGVKGKLFPKDSIIISTSATIGEYALIKTESLANQRFTYLIIKEEYKFIIDIKFILYYCNIISRLCRENIKIGNFLSVDMDKFKSFKIPIPPLEVQEEIVRILDKLTISFEELKERLEKEFEYRLKQYEYYRDTLLTFGEDVPRVKLKDVCVNFIVPIRDKPKIFSGKIPWCRIEDVEGKYFNGSKTNRYVSEYTINSMNLKVFPIGTVICSCSASIGTYAINTVPLVTNQTFIGIVVNGNALNNEFLRYYMETQTNKLVSLSNTSTIPYISRKKFEELLISLPPLPEQERIVSILDKFDKLCNDMREGLPAEIEARRKQYEYYRYKLLTFKEIESN